MDSSSANPLPGRSVAVEAQASRTIHRNRMNRWAYPLVLLALGIYALTPWLAPVFMRLGWEQPARWIYLAYGTQCHQLANRSYFLFGPRLMYSPEELAAAGAAEGMTGMRAFQGSPEVGWKVAWSDRMVAMYSSAFVFLAAFRVLGRRVHPFPWWAFALLLVPLGIDGTTHFLSDLSGFGLGFRDDNAWLLALTNGALPRSFTAGDAWGSFNAWARLVSGVLFGLAVAGLIGPRLPTDVAPVKALPASLPAVRRETPPDAVPGAAYNWGSTSGVGRFDAT